MKKNPTKSTSKAFLTNIGTYDSRAQLWYNLDYFIKSRKKLTAGEKFGF